MIFLTQNNYKEIAQALLNGSVALIPTDTVYGLAACPGHNDSIEKIYRLKQRPDNFNLPILVSKIDDLYALGLDVNKNAIRILNSPFVPGAMTLVLGFASEKRPSWLEGREEVAVRIPDSAFLLSVLEITGPLLATSANRHRSQANIRLISEILDDLNGEPDIVVDAGALSFVPSTIVNCRFEKIKVEREGQVTVEQLENYLNNE